MNRVFVIDGVRTPFLKARGVANFFRAADLGVFAAKPIIARLNLDADKIDEVIVGNVIPLPDELNIARIIALRIGLNKRIPARTVQRNCGSGLEAITTACESILTGRADLILAGGVEAMSRAPIQWSQEMADWFGKMRGAKTLPEKIKMLFSFRFRCLKPVIALVNGLTDPIYNMSMGSTAEQLAYRFNIKREEQDRYAMESHRRFSEASEKGLFKKEIEPIFDFKGNVYKEDNGVRRDSTLENLAKLKPAFDKYGTVTSGNSSQITDGAAMLLLASEKFVLTFNLPVLGEIVDYSWAGVDPREMGIAPVQAISKILLKHNLKMKDLNHLEINEAFAAQVLACRKAFNDPKYLKEEVGVESFGNLEPERLNPHGGAIACGHPVGASGARLVLHLLISLQNSGNFGMASLCVGGGQGGAILVKKEE